MDSLCSASNICSHLFWNLCRYREAQWGGCAPWPEWNERAWGTHSRNQSQGIDRSFASSRLSHFIASTSLIVASYIASYLSLSDTQGTSIFCIFLQGMWDYVWIMRPTPFIALCNVLQGAVAQYAANQTRNTCQTCLHQVHWVLLCALHSIGEQQLYVSSKGRSILVILLKDTGVRLGFKPTLGNTGAWVRCS